MRPIFIIIAAIFFPLTGCKESLTQDYLFQHPNILRKEYIRCQNINKESSFCDMVIESAEEFTKLENMQRENPESFGREILSTELKLADTRANIQKLNQEYQNLTAAHASESELKSVREKLEVAKKTYNAQSMHVTALLAVISDSGTPGL